MKQKFQYAGTQQENDWAIRGAAPRARAPAQAAWAGARAGSPLENSLWPG
jgi:hypothetical protein